MERNNRSFEDFDGIIKKTQKFAKKNMITRRNLDSALKKARMTLKKD